jgi:hypothetical protein
MLEIPRRKLLGMTMAVFGFFTTQSLLVVFGYFHMLQDHRKFETTSQNTAATETSTLIPCFFLCIRGEFGASN